MCRFRTRASVAATALVAVGCGGAAPQSKAPSAPTASTESGGASEASDAPRKTAEPAAPKPRCDDGSCFACGSGACPTGFYCDEGAPGGATCSWVPACAKTASCECLSRALGSASCTTNGGGPHVGG